MKQETRQWITAAVAYGSWAAAVVLTYLRLAGWLPMQYGTIVILCIGFAMAAGIKLSRMRLTETMIEVYRAGVETARVQREERDEMERRIIEAHDHHNGESRDA